MLVRYLTLIWVILSGGVAYAQVNRYMVFFTDKVGTSYSVDNPGEFLSQRAIDRRQRQNISITEEDIPVVASYIESVQAVGATVLYNTKWMNGVLVECDQSIVSSIQNLSFVASTEYVAPGGRNDAGGRKSSKNKIPSARSAAVTDTQLSITGLDQMHDANYKGEGVLIAVFDAGFPGADQASAFTHVFQDGRVDTQTSYDFVAGGNNVFRHNNHGTRVWSVIGGYQDGTFVGGAYKASFILCVTEDSDTEYRIEEYNWLFAAERSDSAGVDIINTSLGYNTFDDVQMNYTKAQMDGETAVITLAAEKAYKKGIVVVTSAGNEGSNSWGIITAPGDGKNVLTTGGITSSGIKTSSSSVGPTADVRIKPDVVALGTGVSTIGADGTIFPGTGTSFSAPIVTSLVAGVWQMLPQLTAKEVMDTIRSTASQAKNPDNQLGYGIANFLSLLNITSIEEGKSSKKFVDIYPNPASKEVVVKPRHQQNTHLIGLSLRTIQGMEMPVKTQRLDDRLIVDIADFPEGLYLIQVKLNNQVSTHKLLKID